MWYDIHVAQCYMPESSYLQNQETSWWAGVVLGQAGPVYSGIKQTTLTRDAHGRDS